MFKLLATRTTASPWIAVEVSGFLAALRATRACSLLSEAAFFRAVCGNVDADFSCCLMGAAVAVLAVFLLVNFTALFSLAVVAVVRAARALVRPVLAGAAFLALTRAGLAAVLTLAAVVLRFAGASLRTSPLRRAAALAVFFFATEVVLAFCLVTAVFAPVFARDGFEAVFERDGLEVRCFGDFASGMAALVLRKVSIFLTEGIRGALLFGPALETGRSGNGRD
ncbi:MAG: hypothetical protein ACLPTZ_16910 [Beijerinckiaceae bacterium]